MCARRENIGLREETTCGHLSRGCYSVSARAFGVSTAAVDLSKHRIARQMKREINALETKMI
jgi:hypothetical protein